MKWGVNLVGQVYMICHNQTGRKYIGQSGNAERRIKYHMTLLRAGKHPVEDMQKDFDEFGDNYTVSILGSNAGHPTLEIEMMEKHGTCIRGNGYNYKDPHVTAKARNEAKPRSTRAKLVKLIDSLDDEQRAHSYELLSSLYGNSKRSKP